MRKTGLTILLLLYAFIQLGTMVCYYTGPVVHAICYELLRSHSSDKDNKRDLRECIIRMDLSAFKKARRDEHEICWNNEFYDIRSIRVNGNFVTLSAEKDIRETRWMIATENMLRRISNNPSPGSHPDTRFCKWLFKIYVPMESMPTLVPFASMVNVNLYQRQTFPVFFPCTPCRPPDTMS